MTKEELIKKAKELLNEGNIEKAKTFIDEHKDELGDYYEKAKILVTSEKIDGLKERLKKLEMLLFQVGISNFFYSIWFNSP